MRVTADFDMNSFVILENYSSYLGLGFPYKIRDLKKKSTFLKEYHFPKLSGTAAFEDINTHNKKSRSFKSNNC